MKKHVHTSASVLAESSTSRLLDCRDVSDCVSDEETGIDGDRFCSHAARGRDSFFLLAQLWQKSDWEELEMWQGCHRITQHPLHNYSIISDPPDSMKCACEQGCPLFRASRTHRRLQTRRGESSQWFSRRK